MTLILSPVDGVAYDREAMMKAGEKALSAGVRREVLDRREAVDSNWVVSSVALDTSSSDKCLCRCQ